MLSLKEYEEVLSHGVEKLMELVTISDVLKN